MSLIELGGGEQPAIRPNADIRWGPNIDLVVDFNWPLPLNNESFDGVYSRYCIEHLSWRKSRLFISEVYRILKPGGIAVVITANLLEQCRKLVENKEWNDDLICMLFGDQNYQGAQWDSNAHHAGFSPDYAIKLFKEAGFYEVKVMPLPQCETDMIIEAHKSKAVLC